jgi:decaprenylphospho-beta-D-erythro-pentofuranosid-2-ulose 2-reductase
MKDSLGAVQSVLVLGGSSDIGLAIAVRLAARRRATVILAGRHQEALERATEVVRSAGAGRVELLHFDATDPSSHAEVLADAARLAGDLDVVVLAFGLLEGDPVRVAKVNYEGVVSAGLVAAEVLRCQGHGTLVVLSSAAGVRVRRANFVYGSSKAGADGFALGLGDALAGSGASVMVVRPGFVRTKMTARRRPLPMAVEAADVAEAVERGLARGSEVVWVPPALRWAFWVLRLLPRGLWRRLPA